MAELLQDELGANETESQEDEMGAEEAEICILFKLLLNFFQEEQESAGEVVPVEVDGVPIGHVLVHQVRTFHVLKSLFFTNKNPRICQDYKRGQNTY